MNRDLEVAACEIPLVCVDRPLRSELPAAEVVSLAALAAEIYPPRCPNRDGACANRWADGRDLEPHMHVHKSCRQPADHNRDLTAGPQSSDLARKATFNRRRLGGPDFGGLRGHDRSPT